MMSDRTDAPFADAKARAIDLLLEGLGPSVVARELGVDRTTLWRWRTEDAAFRAEHDRRRDELDTAVTDRLVALVDAAIDVERELLAEGDPNAAHAIIRSVGMRLLLDVRAMRGTADTPEEPARRSGSTNADTTAVEAPQELPKTA